MEPHLCPLTPRSRNKTTFAAPIIPNNRLPKSHSTSVSMPDENSASPNSDSPLTPLQQEKRRKKDDFKGMDEATR